MMTSRELVERTLRFENPERIPRHLWILPSAYLAHGTHLVDLLQKYPLDINPRPPVIPEMGPEWRKGTFIDEWGSVWENLDDGIAGEVKHPVLDDWSKLDQLKPPPVPENYGDERVSVLNDYPDAFVTIVGGQIFERLQYVRGPENMYMDLAEQSKELFRLREIVMDNLHKKLDVCLKTPCHAVQYADDWGSQRSLLISPAMWREFFKPCYKELFQRIKDAGKFLFMHSDGFIIDIIDDFIELGVDALNCQVWLMGPEKLGERFAGRITFWGELNRQKTVPNGTSKQIRSDIETMKKHLATDDGGLIAQSEIDRLTPIENIEEILKQW